ADTMTVALTNRRPISRLKAFVRSDGGNARLSDEAFTSGLAAQKHFLRALFTADAALDYGSLELRCESLGLLQDVQLLLLGFGIQSGISMETTNFGEGGARTGGGLPDRQVDYSSRDPRDGSPGARSHDNPNRADAVNRRHGLRIDPGSLRSFAKHIALLPGRKLEALASACGFAIQRDESRGNFDHVRSLRHLGRQ